MTGLGSGMLKGLRLWYRRRQRRREDRKLVVAIREVMRLNWKYAHLKSIPGLETRTWVIHRLVIQQDRMNHMIRGDLVTVRYVEAPLSSELVIQFADQTHAYGPFLGFHDIWVTANEPLREYLVRTLLGEK